MIEELIKKSEGKVIKGLVNLYGLNNIKDILIQNEYLPEKHFELLNELYIKDGIRYICASLLDHDFNDVLDGHNKEINYDKRIEFVRSMEGVNAAPFLESYKILKRLEDVLPKVRCRKCCSDQFRIHANESSYVFVKVNCNNCGHDTTVLTHCRKSGQILTYSEYNSCYVQRFNERVRGDDVGYCCGIINDLQMNRICMKSCRFYGVSNDYSY